MSDPASFDVLLPARSTAGPVEVAYAVLTLNRRTAALLCDRIGWARGASSSGAWAAHRAPIDDGTLRWLDHLPWYYQPCPGYRDISLEQALDRVSADGFAITPWEMRQGRIPVGAGAMTVTPFGVSWRGTVYEVREPRLADEARFWGTLGLLEQMDPAPERRRAPVSRRPRPTAIAAVETGPLALAVLRRMADGAMGLPDPGRGEAP